jgi:hypothetical protein
MDRRKQAVLGRAKGARTLKKVKKLNEAALKLVEDNATKIAESLYDSTLDGNVLSARLLVELAEGNVEVEEAVTMRPLRSLALALAAEPEWPYDKVEAARVMGDGSRKPEGA